MSSEQHFKSDISQISFLKMISKGRLKFCISKKGELPSEKIEYKSREKMEGKGLKCKNVKNIEGKSYIDITI